jgi:energy-coupling factor transporter ATP-binding protein EcfA2
MIPIVNVVAYWRACLADTARLNIDSQRLKTSYHVSTEAVKAGRIPTTVASKIIEALQGENATPQRQAPQTILHDEEKLASVLICPIVACPRTNHTVHTVGNDTVLTPVWIPAQLSQDGTLSPRDNQLPWIPRHILEPVFQAAETIGDMETLDKFMTRHPCLQNEADPAQPPRWIDVWQYSNAMLQAVAQQTLDRFIFEGYDTIHEAYIVSDVDVRSSAHSILRLYDAILRRLEDQTAAPPRLLPRLTNWHAAPLSPLLDAQQSIAMSAKHLGQMRQDYPLSPSQRVALHHFLTLTDGEILAINGPPGTGKTTLLQSIVASLWVHAAIHDRSEPPIMFAVSMNNQAVTNIIDSFGNVPEDSTPLGGRWIPGINSYALYCPASSRQHAAQQKQYQMTSLQGGFCVPPPPEAEPTHLDPWNIESEACVAAAEQNFLHRYRQYATREVTDVQEAVTLLQRQLVETTIAIKQGVQTWLQMHHVHDELSGRYEAHGGLETYMDQLTHDLTTCRQRAVEAKRAQGGWLAHLDTAPWWMTLLAFLPPVQHRVSIRNRRYCASLPIEVVADVSNTKEIMDFFDRLVQESQSEVQRLAGALRQVEHDHARWQSLQQAWHTWCTQHALPHIPHPYGFGKHNFSGGEFLSTGE